MKSKFFAVKSNNFARISNIFVINRTHFSQISVQIVINSIIRTDKFKK